MLPSTTVSHGFSIARHSSPPFGSCRMCSHSESPVQSTRKSGGCCGSTRQGVLHSSIGAANKGVPDPQVTILCFHHASVQSSRSHPREGRDTTTVHKPNTRLGRHLHTQQTPWSVLQDGRGMTLTHQAHIPASESHDPSQIRQASHRFNPS